MRHIALALALALVGTGVGVFAQTQPKSAFAEKTGIATTAFGTIESRVGDIRAMLSDAQSKGQSERQACVAAKLKRAQTNLDAAKVVMEGWSLGQNNPEYAQRNLDRLLLMQVYSLVYQEEARACEEEKPTPGGNIDIKVDHTLPNGPNGDDGLPSPTRPPRIDRPPLASPF